MRNVHVLSAVAVCAFMALALGGCRDAYPHSFTIATGDIIPTHAKPAEGGYYTNWDPFAVSLELTPVVDVNPVQTQHILIATVRDKDGKPLPNRRVEWMIPEESVGVIVEVDESGWRASRGHKVTNRYAVSHTNNFDHVLTRGNDDPSDDIQLKKGQTWCVITSPVEGTTHMIAYAPGIYNWDKHKVFAQKHWRDVKWEMPPPATNPIDTPHTFTTRVLKHSDGAPLAGYEVTYQIVGGPAASFGGRQATTVRTDAGGNAAATITQTTPVEGVNDVKVDIVRPAEGGCDPSPALRVATGKTTKTWIGPKIAITKTAPATALVGDVIDYNITVSNPSQVAAKEVVLSDKLPDGMQYVSSSPQAQVNGSTLWWQLGTLAGGGSSSATIQVKATRTGDFRNCADVAAKYGLSARACADTKVGAAKLTLRKTAPAEVLICEPIPYEFTVTNVGDAAATNVRLSDTLPDGLVFSDDRKAISVDIGTLGPGGSKVLRYTAKATRRGSFTNTATVAGDRGLSAADQATTRVLEPVLTVKKSGPATRFVGQTIRYTIRVANTGDGPARGTVLTDVLPAQAAFVSADNNGSAGNGRVVWNLGDLAPGASRTVGVVLKGTTVGDLENVATAVAQCTEASDKRTTAVRGIPAILLECVDEGDPLEVGSNVRYTITVRNQGSAVGTNVVIRCVLPAQLKFVSATAPVKETVQGQAVTFAPIESLAIGASATYEVVAQGTGVGDVRFKVSLTSNQSREPVEETESTNIYAK